MKTFACLGWLMIAFGAVGLLGGCASNRATKTTQQVTADSNFEVVESSAKRPLTAAELAQLNVAVAQFLETQGAVASGDYYVKVYLTPDQGGVPSDWVVVRFTRDTDLRFTLLGSYPAYSYGYRSYAAYDYYPYGYNSFGRISFHYYDDPFYGSRCYYPPRHRGSHSQPHDGNQGKGHDRKGNPGSRHPGYNVGTAANPAPGGPPAPTNHAWDESDSPKRNNKPPGQYHPSRNQSPPKQTEGVQASGNNFTPSGAASTRNERPTPTSYSPPNSNNRAARNLAPGATATQERNNQTRGQNYPTRNESPRRQSERVQVSGNNSSSTGVASPSPRSERPAPASYSPPVSRPEPRENHSGNHGPKEPHRASPDNTRLEN